MVYLKDSFIARSFLFLFIQIIALLQGLIAIKTGAGFENLLVEKCCIRSQKPRVLVSTLAWFELFDVIPCSSSPSNAVSLGSISVSLDSSHQSGKKPGSAGAGLPQSEDMSHDMNCDPGCKKYRGKIFCSETNILNVQDENIYRCVTYIYICMLWKL